MQVYRVGSLKLPVHIAAWAVAGLTTWPERASPALFNTFVKAALARDTALARMEPLLRAVLKLCGQRDRLADAPALRSARRSAVIALHPPFIEQACWASGRV